MSLPQIGAGRRLYVCSPSGAVLDTDRLTRGLATLSSLGFRVECDPALGRRQQRFAGSDEERLAALYRAGASGCDLVMATRGGYGLTRLLPAIDWRRLQGPVWIGHSDFTALALAGHSRGLRAWNGPMVVYDFGAETLDRQMLDSLGQALQGQIELDFASDTTLPTGLLAEGPLWGGNLSMLVSLLGTPWWPRIDGLLWLEEVNEAPYRVERMLLQLLQAGVLGTQGAILIGGVIDYRLSPLDDGFDLPSVVETLRERLSVPILTGLPFGHCPAKSTLPNGWHARLEAQHGKARLLSRAP